MPLRIPIKPHTNGDGRDHEPIDWEPLKREILRRLDLKAEFEALGVVFTGKPPTAKGYMECYGVGRDANDPDTRPSAAANVRTGYYLDSGLSGKAVKFWDFALANGPSFGSFGQVLKHYAQKAGVEYGDFRRTSGGAIVESDHEYRDADGSVKYRTRRIRLANGRKQYALQAWDGDRFDGKSGCMEGVEPLPYRFPELLASPEDEVVLFVAGEKCVDRAVEAGFTATTNHMGEANWRRTGYVFLGRLPARDYAVIPDNDEVGRRHAEAVADDLASMLSIAHGPSWEVKVLTLPDLPVKGDLVEWLELGGTPEELRRMIADCPRWEVGSKLPEPEKPGPEPVPDARPESPRRKKKVYASLADATALIAGTRWAWEGWIPNGSLSLLAARRGTGKTRMAMELARRLWYGLRMPDEGENPFPERTRTLWILPDRNWRETADVAESFGVPTDEAIRLNSELHTPLLVPELDDPGTILDLREQVLDERPGMIFIDTITYATSKNTARSEEAKAAFDGIMQVAAETGVAVVGLAHLGLSGDVLNRRIEERARSVISLTKPDPDGQPSRRKLWVSKTASIEPPPLGVTYTTACNEFDLFPPEPPDEDRPPPRRAAKTDECAAWLRKLLVAGALAKVEVEKVGFDQHGYGASLIYDARGKLGDAVEDFKQGGRVHWKLRNVAIYKEPS